MYPWPRLSFYTRSCGSAAQATRSQFRSDFLMKFSIRIPAILCILCASVASVFALDREAFTFTKYDLQARLEPEQQRLGVRGKITLRNDSATPQKIAVLQISSSLDWRSITIGSKVPQFVLQSYTSDIDHTGAVSEAIVTLPQEVPPHGTLDLDVGYEGVIALDATRLTRIGSPEDAAKSSDWDQISANFTAVRGIGYVTWYPIATESANLSEGDSLSEVLAGWKQREAGSQMKVVFDNPETASEGPSLLLLCNGAQVLHEPAGKNSSMQCDFGDVSHSVPTFAAADYGNVSRPSVEVFNLPAHAVAASAYADVAEQAASVITNWFGPLHGKLQVADLPGPDAAPFGSGSLLLSPLATNGTQPSGLAAAYQFTGLAFWSFRPWIGEGLAHFAQALYLEQKKGRQVALGYMTTHRGMLVQSESSTTEPDSAEQASHSLVNSTDEIYLQSKAMAVWWMLRDMVGDAALRKAISLYRSEQDKEPSYMQRLIAAQTSHDLEWFFDDWVYRDHGLPDFKIESVYPRQTMTGAYIITITVDNMGSAGAEVPVILKFGAGQQDISKRLEIRAKSKATVRVESSSRPVEVVVNDGSVPESDTTNNNFAVEPEQK
jgi:hypothetical protein